MPSPSSAAVSSVESHFSRAGLGASSEWIHACVDWCLGEGGLAGSGSGSREALNKACVQQWAGTDIRDEGVQDNTRPKIDADAVRTRVKTDVPAGRYAVQVSKSVAKLA